MAALSGLLSDVRAVWGLSLLLKLLSSVCVFVHDPLMGMDVCVSADSAPQRDTLDCIRMSEGVSLILGQLRH